MNQSSPRNAAQQARPLVQRALGKPGARSGDTDHRRSVESPPQRLRQVAQADSSLARLRLKHRDVVNMTVQLAIMARAGVDIAGGLQSLARQCRSPAVKKVLSQVHESVLGGSSLSESLGQFPRAFGETFVASIAAGEASGRLPDVLQQLASLLRGEQRLRNSLRTMLAYPVLLVVVSSLVLLALLLFVLPQFQTIFEDFDAPLPAITQVLLAISAEMRYRYWLWGPIFLAAFAGLYAFGRSAPGRQLKDRATLNFLLFREVTRALLIGRTCRLLGIMIDSGVPLLDSLRLSRSSVRNSLYRQLFDRLEDDVLNGRGLATAMLESEFIPGAAAEMMLTAEKTGALGTVTQLIGEHYEEEGEAKLKELVAVVEPAVTVFMGAVVAVIVMSVMLPLFDLSSAAKRGN
jgi:type II secretory pathway component PulF